MGRSSLRQFLILAGCVALWIAPNIAEARTIEFAGITWWVKSGVGGPGPNNWSNSTNSVWVDSQGRLHLKIHRIGGTWYCSEVIAQESFGYATYTVKASCNPASYDPNSVVGFFTYKNDTEEIDIELTRWGNSADTTDAQFAVQPSAPNTSSRVRFSTGLTGDNPPATYSFTWSPDSIDFLSYHGHGDAPPSAEDLIYEHTYVGSKNPPLSDATFRINFWMFRGNTPTSEMELIVDDVIITPFNECDVDGECDDGLFCNGAETCVDHVCESGNDTCTGHRQHCDETLDRCVCEEAGLAGVEDLTWFSTCLDGPGIAPEEECLCADWDQDGDADLRDFAALQRVFRPGVVLYDFENGSQGWSSFGNGTTGSGASSNGSTGSGRFHTANFNDSSMTWGFGDKSPNGVNLSAYTGMAIDARLESPDANDPFVGSPIVEFMLSIGYMEWAEEMVLSDTYSTFTVDFDDLVPQGTASQPVTASQLSNPGMRIKLIMRKRENSGKVRLYYDQVQGLP